MAGDRTDPDRSLVSDATAAFETGLEFLTELQRRFLARPGEAAAVPVAPPAPPRGDLVVTRVPTETIQRFRVAAGARGMDPGEYLARLVDLHAAMRRLADEGGHAEVSAVLVGLGLATVTA